MVLRKTSTNYQKAKHFSEEHIRKLVEAKKGNKNALGHRLSPEIKKRLSEASEKNNPRYWLGKKRSEDTIRKVSENTRKAMCRPDIKEKITKTQFKKGTPPEKHPRWKGGIAYLPYCYKFNKTLKEKIRERDNRTCQLCNVKENGRKLDIHHIHYDKPNCKPDLISLCRSCNAKVNSNREYYENFFMKNLALRGLLK